MVNSRTFFIGAAALLMAPAATLAQTVASPPTDQAAPAAADAPDPAAAAPAPAQDTAPATDADGVTKEGGKYMKDGRKATKTEIAQFKKAEKAKQ